MKRYVSIYFKNLIADWFAIRNPSLVHTPFVVTTLLHGRKIIIAANNLSRAQGINEGMPLADARAIVPALQDFDEVTNLSERLLQKLAQLCIRYSPYVSVDPPSGILIDASGCAHLWDTEENYTWRIKERLEQRGYHVHLCIADTIGAAWAMARYGKQIIIEHANNITAIKSLPIAALRIDPATIAVLNKLGLRTIDAIINMPRASLRRRFGAILLQRLDEATGMRNEIITPIITPSLFEERLYCIEPISTRTGIEIALQQILATLCIRLQKEGKGVRSIKFTGHRIDGNITFIETGTSRASSNATHLFKLLQLQLEKFEPALGIEVFCIEAVKVDEQSIDQSALWEAPDEWNDHKIGELIDRITSKLGPGKVTRYVPAEHYWPERSYRKASVNEPSDAEWKGDRPRPLRMLKIPARIQVTAPVPDYPPMNFRYQNKLHTIKRAEGPERFEQEWWLQQGEHRDYYYVEDEEGMRYWLFRLGHYNQHTPAEWFLHGLFA